MTKMKTVMMKTMMNLKHQKQLLNHQKMAAKHKEKVNLRRVVMMMMKKNLLRSLLKLLKKVLQVRVLNRLKLNQNLEVNHQLDLQIEREANLENQLPLLLNPSFKKKRERNRLGILVILPLIVRQSL